MKKMIFRVTLSSLQQENAAYTFWLSYHRIDTIQISAGWWGFFAHLPLIGLFKTILGCLIAIKRKGIKKAHSWDEEFVSWWFHHSFLLVPKIRLTWRICNWKKSVFYFVIMFLQTGMILSVPCIHFCIAKIFGPFSSGEEVSAGWAYWTALMECCFPSRKNTDFDNILNLDTAILPLIITWLAFPPAPLVWLGSDQSMNINELPSDLPGSCKGSLASSHLFLSSAIPSIMVWQPGCGFQIQEEASFLQNSFVQCLCSGEMSKPKFSAITTSPHQGFLPVELQQALSNGCHLDVVHIRR